MDSKITSQPDGGILQMGFEPSQLSDAKSPEEKPIQVQQAQMTYPEGGARAWSVTFGAAGALFCTFGYANAFGVYQEYYQTHQLKHASPSAISWVGSIQTFFLMGGALFSGPLFDQYGALVIWPSAIAYVFSVMMTSISKSYYQFFLAQGILGGFCMGMIMAPAMAAIGQYFYKKRGVSMGLAVAGSSLGGVIFPVALSKMLYNPSLGFGWTVRICGLIMLALLVLSSIGIRARLPPRKGTLFLPAAFKEFCYVTLIGSLFLMVLGVFTPFFYLPVYAVEHGMSTQLAGYIISILNGASLFGRIIPGILADKFGPLNVLFISAVSTGILIFCWPKMESNASIIVFAGLYGYCSGSVVSLMSVTLARIPKDPRNIGTYMGMGMAVISFAALTGPPINGAFLSRYGTFDQMSIFSGSVVMAGGFLVLWVKIGNGKGVFTNS